MTDLSHTESKLGFLSSGPSRFPEEFEYLTSVLFLPGVLTHEWDPSIPNARETARSGPDRLKRGRMVNCLLQGTKAAIQKAVSYEKVREIYQDRPENPAVFSSLAFQKPYKPTLILMLTVRMEELPEPCISSPGAPLIFAGSFRN